MKKIEFITAKLVNEGTLTKDEMVAILSAVEWLNEDLKDGLISRLNPAFSGLVSLNQEVK
jgi:hypothetical protein